MRRADDFAGRFDQGITKPGLERPDGVHERLNIRNRIGLPDSTSKNDPNKAGTY
jgi:hypothetical protein